MIRNPEELTTAIKSAVNRRAVVLSHLILAGAITTHTVLWPATEPYEAKLAVAISAALVLLILFRFFDLAKINNHPLVYTIVYEILTFVGISFLTEAATPYVLVAMITTLIANLYYGAKGVFATVGVFGLATITKFFVFMAEDGPMSRENTIDIFAAFFVFAALSSLFVSIQKVYDWDRSRLKTIIREATIGQKRLRTLINSMTESVLVLDRNGVVRLYNAAALALFDTNSSLENQRPADFATFEDEKGAIVRIEDLLPETPNPVARNDIKLKYSKEDTASLSITITPLSTSFGQGDNYTGYILTMRDITREKSLEEERNEFISVISHELRTPVTVTEASLSNALMMHDKFGGSEEVKKTLVTAHEQSIFLANMLNDLSTFARAEKGTLELNLEEIDPAELVRQLETDYRNEAEVKGLHVLSRVDAGLPANIVSNRLYIREILQNFITNGIKYSDSGSITIAVMPDGETGVRFEVSDQGIGISVSDQKKVFNKFFRSEDFRTRSRNGTGLGLYIVRKLAKLLEANISLSSELGKGSTFSLQVPSLRELLDARSHEKKTETPPPKSEPESAAEPEEEAVRLTTSSEDDDIEELEHSLAITAAETGEQPAPAEQQDDTSETKPSRNHNHAASFHLQKQR